MANLPAVTDLLDWSKGTKVEGSFRMLSYHDSWHVLYPTTPYGAALCHSDPETFERALRAEVSERTHVTPWLGCSYRGSLVRASEKDATVEHVRPIGD